MSVVYLIHFDDPYPRDSRGSVQHYIGFSGFGRGMLRRRLGYHAAGSGARLMDAVRRAGIGWRVVRLWWGEGREFERRLKRCKKAREFCPVCRGERVRLRAPYWVQAAAS